MDFAALMSKEISKAKPESTSKPTSEARARYLKRAEVERQREEAYEAEQRAIRADKEAKLCKKRKAEEDDAQRNREREEKRARRKRLGLPDLPPKSSSEAPLAEGEDDVPEAELVLKLREKDEPIRLFGESHRQRLRRFRRLDQKPMVGFTTLELLPEADMKVDAVPKDGEAKKYLFRQLASYFSMVLNEWERALDQRAQSVRDSFQGKAAYHAMVQARENMRPLFRRFESGELDVLESVVEIVKAAQEKRYVDANDGYLRLSIGKA